jgi:hypothetical protein
MAGMHEWLQTLTGGSIENKVVATERSFLSAFDNLASHSAPPNLDDLEIFASTIRKMSINEEAV